MVYKGPQVHMCTMTPALWFRGNNTFRVFETSRSKSTSGANVRKFSITRRISQNEPIRIVWEQCGYYYNLVTDKT
jgi:hypothetical protein